MAQNQFINVMAGSKQSDGSYSHQPSHASANASDLTLSWDSAKFTTKSAVVDALRKMVQYINSRGDLAA